MGCIDHVGNRGQPPRRSLAFTLSSGQRFNREIFGKFREAPKVSRFGTLFWKDRGIGLPKTSTWYYLKWKTRQKYKNSQKRSKKGEAFFWQHLNGVSDSRRSLIPKFRIKNKISPFFMQPPPLAIVQHMGTLGIHHDWSETIIRCQFR